MGVRGYAAAFLAALALHAGVGLGLERLSRERLRHVPPAAARAPLVVRLTPLPASSPPVPAPAPPRSPAPNPAPALPKPRPTTVPAPVPPLPPEELPTPAPAPPAAVPPEAPGVTAEGGPDTLGVAAVPVTAAAAAVPGPAAPVTAAAAAAAGPPGSVPEPPRLRGEIRPAYPLSARRDGVEGTVRVQARVSPTGRTEECWVARSSGSAALDRAALRAVRSARFDPARRQGRTVAEEVTVTVRFLLTERRKEPG